MAVKEVILHFTEGENEGVEIKLTPPRVIRIGRSEESDIFLGEKKISRKHSILHLGEDALSITDLDSTNGTFVNSKRITEILLEDGDRVRIGSSVLEVQISFDQEAQNVATKPEVEKESLEQQKPIKKTEDIDLSFTGERPSDEISKPQSFEDQDKEEVVEEDSDLVVEYQEPRKKSVPKEEDLSAKTVMEASEEEFDLGSLDVKEGTSSEVSQYQDEDEFELDDPVKKPMTSDELDLNKIPEIAEISEDLDQDFLPSDEASIPKKDAKKKSKTLSGDLSAMGLADLLQNLKQNQKTGSLSLKAESIEGVIYILKGNLHSAQVGKAVGSKAVYRMLGWDEGDFEFQPLDEDASEFNVKGITPISESVDGLLMEGMRQLDEINKIKSVLPKPKDKLALHDQSDVPLSKLHPKVLDIVQLILSHKRMQDVMDLSPLSDLETAKIIFYLLKKKLIVVK